MINLPLKVWEELRYISLFWSFLRCLWRMKTWKDRYLCWLMAQYKTTRKLFSWSTNVPSKPNQYYTLLVLEVELRLSWSRNLPEQAVARFTSLMICHKSKTKLYLLCKRTTSQLYLLRKSALLIQLVMKWKRYQMNSKESSVKRWSSILKTVWTLALSLEMKE